jgi:hypothetical protein
MTLQKLINRRDALNRCACGFGGLALSYLLANRTLADKSEKSSGLHHAARANRVIFLYMDGGPSQLDTFDPKPRLTELNGQPFPMNKEPTQFDDNGTTMGSPWKFNQYGESGLWVSDLFPNVAKHADKLCVVRSMTSQFSEHTNANYFLHTGHGLAGRPSMGAWTSYGLGSEADDLPSFVVINGGLTPPGGPDNFASGFLPPSYQGSVFASNGPVIANLQSSNQTSLQRIERRRSTLKKLDEQFAASLNGSADVDSAIANYELAYRMQVAVPDVTDISQETEVTKQSYGIDHPNKALATFARECLLARRLAEHGVRFIELTCPQIQGHDRWDQHSNLLGGHADNAMAVDQPIAALLEDLQARGLLDDTLVVWAGEFGRTPFAQGSNGRDHNPFAFSIWLAGGGVKPGSIYGETDEFGYKVMDKPIEMYDLHATMLHLMGIDHERLTYRFGGRDHRLTDVHGKVIHDWLA